MSEWNGNCQRCGAPSTGHIMSMYNLELICFPCKDEEKKRPDYHLAEARDLREHASKLRSKGMAMQADNVIKVAKWLEARE